MMLSPCRRALFFASAALTAAFQPAFACAFSFSARTMTTNASRHPRTRKFGSNIPVLFSSLSSAGAGETMSKVEAAGVRRFTESYDKLCKSCPTRIQPRVDTLAEMILGLPDGERDELMEIVAGRLLEAQKRRVVSSRDVYEFQTSSSGGVAVKPEKRKKSGEKKRPASRDTSANKQQEEGSVNLGEEEDNSIAKLLKKREKAKIKFDSNKQHVVRVDHLLAVSNALHSGDSHRGEPTRDTLSNPVDNGWHHEIDRLKKLSSVEFKMEQLKLNAKKAKHEQKIAKQRMKLYSVDLKLADARTRMENNLIKMH